MINWLLSSHFPRFAVVGGLGFLVDGGILTLLLQQEWSVFAARTCSFSAAVSMTWSLNRIWTFSTRGNGRGRREYASYFGTQIIGAAINLSVFFAVVNLQPVLLQFPYIPLAVGALISAAFTYTASRRFVFQKA